MKRRLPVPLSRNGGGRIGLRCRRPTGRKALERRRAGHGVLTLRRSMPRAWPGRQLLCADIDSFRLHAALRCEASDRKRLMLSCRSITRAGLVNERGQRSAADQAC
jgi:hypothetical protein